MNDSEICIGKIYLVKLKVDDTWGGKDLLWAICHTGKDNVDLDDFKNIATIDGKGLYSPLLSSDRVTWKSLKMSADCKALGASADSVLLLSGVNTFLQVLEFAYSKGILVDGRGRGIVAAKRASIDELQSQPRQSQTIEEASQDLEGRGGNSGTSGGGVLSSGSGVFDSGLGGNHTGSSAAFIAMEKEVVAAFDINIFENTRPAVHTGGGSSGSVVGPVSERARADLAVSKIDMDAFDNEMEQIELDVDSVRKLSRMQSLLKTMRKSLSLATLSNQRLVQALDASDMKMRSLNQSSTTEVVGEVRSLAGKLDALIGQTSARGEEMSSGVTSLRKELGDLNENVQMHATVNKDESANIVRHLGSFGMVDIGSTFNIPEAISSIYRILNDDILPTFKSGGVIPWVAQRGVAGNLLLPVGDPAVISGQMAQHSSAGFGGHSGSASSPAVMAPPMGFTAWKRFSDGTIKQPIMQNTVPVVWNTNSSVSQQPNVTQSGPLLSLPPQFQGVEQNYMGVQHPSNGGQFGVPQHTPPQGFQYVGQHPAPAPPVKSMQQIGCPPASGVIRRLFQPSAPQMPAYYEPQQSGSFAPPPPPLQPKPVVTITTAVSEGFPDVVSHPPAVTAPFSGPGPSASGSGGGKGQ